MFRHVSIAEMESINKGKDGHWFDKEAMRFFNTRFVDGPNMKNFFITSERNPEGRTSHTVRWFNYETGDVETVGKFHSLTKSGAQNLRKAVSDIVKDFSNAQIKEYLDNSDDEYIMSLI